jgi:NADH-quinone oxidoreductase subunit A
VIFPERDAPCGSIGYNDGREVGMGMTSDVQFLPIFVYFVLIVGFAGLITAMTLLLGSIYKRPTPKKLMPYESGMVPLTPARVRIPIHFHLIAMLFLIFDIEAAFIFPWALVFKQLGLAGVIEMFVFIGILLVGFWYALKRGAFVWQ